MAVLLQIKNARKSYGDQVLLDGAETTLSDNVRYGFVGRNGAGKSTLLRAILGEEQLAVPLLLEQARDRAPHRAEPHDSDPTP